MLHKKVVLSVLFGFMLSLIAAQCGVTPPLAIISPSNADQLVELNRLGHTDKVNNVAFAPDGQTLASGGNRDSGLKLWQVSEGRLLNTLHTSLVVSVAFAPDGQTLASASLDGTVKLWQVSDGRLLNTLHTSSVWSVAFAPDGQTLASASIDSTVQLWQVSDGRLLNTLEGHAGLVNSVAFAPDGQTLASGSRDGEAVAGERRAIAQHLAGAYILCIERGLRAGWTDPSLR